MALRSEEKPGSRAASQRRAGVFAGPDTIPAVDLAVGAGKAAETRFLSTSD